MPDQDDDTRGWQPFTWGGIVLLAESTFSRYVICLIIWALPVSICLSYFSYITLIPAVDPLLKSLPSDLTITSGYLTWTPPEPVILSETWFLSISMHPDPRTPFESLGSDVHLQFFPRELRLHSPFGYLPLYYPSILNSEFSGTAMLPWWGAFKPLIPGFLLPVFLVGLLFCWQCMALFYGLTIYPILKLIRGSLPWKKVRRICNLSMISGAWVMSLGLLAYAFGMFNFYGLTAVFASHLLIPPVFIFGSLLKATNHSSSVPNPFQRSKK